MGCVGRNWHRAHVRRLLRWSQPAWAAWVETSRLRANIKQHPTRPLKAAWLDNRLKALNFASFRRMRSARHMQGRLKASKQSPNINTCIIRTHALRASRHACVRHRSLSTQLLPPRLALPSSARPTQSASRALLQDLRKTMRSQLHCTHRSLSVFSPVFLYCS